MPSSTPRTAQEFSYEAYQRRQQQEVQAPQLNERARHLRFGHKFRYESGTWRCLPYEGYAIVSMVTDNPGNEELLEQLSEVQAQLRARVGLPHKLYPLPPTSFHQTVANTLSAHRYQQQVVEPGLEAAYPTIVGRALEQLPPAERTHPIRMQLIGLSLFGSAIGVLGTFEAVEDFQAILRFRDHLYQHDELGKLDIRRTRPFVGHITLLYFGHDLGEADGARLAKACAGFNESLFRTPWEFAISHTQLRKYEDLSAFRLEPHFPTHTFIRS